MGIASAEADLKTLKTLGFNSIEFSSVSNKKQAYRDFSKAFNTFINEIVDRGTLIPWLPYDIRY